MMKSIINKKNGLLKFGFTWAVLLSFCYHVSGQVLNDNINYELLARSVGWSIDDELSEEEVVHRFLLLDDVNNSPTDLTNNGNATDECVTFDAYCNPFCFIEPYKFLYRKTNSSSKKVDFTHQAWEDDGTLGNCIPESADDHFGTQNWLLEPQITNRSPSGFRHGSFTINSNDATTFIQMVWRYTAGNNFNDPLDFGVLGSGDSKVHLNSQRNRPPGYHSDLEYTNTYHTNHPNGQATRDVVYQFEISDIAKQVTITTGSDETDINTYIHVLKSGAGSAKNHIISANNNDPSWPNRETISLNLCPGIYFVVVEKAGSTNPNADFSGTNNFQISVQVEDMPANDITIGSIGANTNTICEGVDLPDIMSMEDAASGIDGLFGSEVEAALDGYEWQKKIGSGGAWITVPNEADNELTATGVMGTEEVFFRRRVTFCGITSAWSNTVSIPYNPSSVSGGAISFVGDTCFRSGLDPGQFLNATVGDGDPLPITYRWQRKNPNQSSWEDIPGAEGLEFNVGAVFQTASYRRIAVNDCSKESPSNAIELVALPADGVISGKITAPPLGIGTGVADIEVCAMPLGMEPGAQEECDTTNSIGEYQITDLFYGKDGVTYRVTPFLQGHEIRINTNSPDSTIDKTLTNNANNQGNVNFVDLTAYTLSGNVYQTFFDGDSAEQFGKSKVVIYLMDGNGVEMAEDTTDAHGNYSIIIPNAGLWTIRPELKEPISPANPNPHQHTFSPASQEILVTDHIQNIDFEDQTTMSISGFVGAGCQNYLGTVGLRFAQNPDDGFFNKVLMTSLNSGNFNFTLPARDYRVTVDENSIMLINNAYELADIRTQFAQFGFNAKLTHADTSFFLYYRAPLSIELTGVPAGPGCGGLNYSLAEQAINYPDFKITVFDGPVKPKGANWIPDWPSLPTELEIAVRDNYRFRMAKWDSSSLVVIRISWHPI